MAWPAVPAMRTRAENFDALVLDSADRVRPHLGTRYAALEFAVEEVPPSDPAAWEEQKAIKEVMVFLQSVGVSTSIAVRIYKKYEDASISVVKNQPYRLAADVWGIGFLTADRIAQAVGIPHDSPERVKAGLQYALSQSTDRGHCFLPEERLIADGVKLLQVDTGLVVVREQHAAIDDQQSAQMLENGHVAADFADSAQRGHP